MDNDAHEAERQGDEVLKTGFSARLNVLLREKNLSQRDLARLTGERPQKINAYSKGAALPAVDTAVAIADALGVTVPYLVLGRQEIVTFGHAVPVLDLRFSAGAGVMLDGEPNERHMSLPDELLQQIGRTSAKGLTVVTAYGDSMAPVIPDGAFVLIDEEDTWLREGIFAFRAGEDLRIKRLRPVGLGDIEAISENPIYPSDRYTGADREHIKIIGRAVWAGGRL